MYVIRTLVRAVHTLDYGSQIIASQCRQERTTFAFSAMIKQFCSIKL
jgi:hypothetical protein